MKKNLLLQSITFALFAILYTSCDNEPVEGEFLSEGCVIVNFPEEGQITASIEGENDYASVIYDEENLSETTFGVLVIHANGFRHIDIEGLSSSQAFMHVNVANPAVGSFDITTTNEFGYVDNVNFHELFQSYGIYREANFEGNNNLKNHVTYAPNGGSGNVRITKFDEVNQLISGTFDFVGKRKMVDDEGNEVVDDAGLPILETAVIDCGSFNNVKYEILHVEGEFIETDFFAIVDGEEFVETTVNTSKTIVSDIAMVKIVATDADGNKIRIDIPEDLGEGTFSMEPISNGTALIAMYNPIVVGENLTSSPGTITITEFNSFIGKIEATFAFTGSDPLGIDPTVVEVTEGSFKVDYLPSVEVNNVITAEINGLPFVSDNTTTTSSSFNGVNRILIQGIDTEDPDIEDDTSQSITFILPEEIEETTHNFSISLIDGTEVIAYYSPDVENINPILVDNGSINVTNYETIDDIIVIDATFSFMVIDTSQDPEVEYQIISGTLSMQIL